MLYQATFLSLFFLPFLLHHNCLIDKGSVLVLFSFVLVSSVLLPFYCIFRSERGMMKLGRHGEKNTTRPSPDISVCRNAGASLTSE